MKNYKILMTQPARDDLKGIATYIVNKLSEPSIAKKLVGKIKEAVMSLSVMPTRHSLVADEKLAIQGIRKIMVDNYIVFYVVFDKDSTVTVLRILYGRRDWHNLL
jgi:addiction module RelE/StbE family toxin